MGVIILGIVGVCFLGLIGLAAGVAIHYSKVEKQQQNKQLVSGYTQKDIDKTLKEARETIKKIDSLTYQISEQVIVNKVRSITNKGSEIIRELKKHPEDVKKARKFLRYYLDAAYNVVNQYAELMKRGISGHEEVLARVEPTLDDILKGFEYEYAKLFDDDIMNLDVEIEVLRKTIEQETKGRS